MNELIRWINEQLERRPGLSGTQASLAAGLNHGAISAIINGQRPGLDQCKKLARYFGVPPEYVLRLAGHVSERATPTDNPRLTHLMDLLARLTPKRRDAYIESMIMLADMEAALDEPSSLVLGGSTASE